MRSVDVASGDAAFREFNGSVQGKVARLTMRDGTVMNVVSLRAQGDSLSWLDRRTNSLQRVAVHDVRHVSIVRAGSGALRGLLVGAVAGAAFGGIRAAVEGDDPASDPLGVSQRKKYRVYPPAHAVYATLATTPLGAIIGTRSVFEFETGGLANR